MHVAERQSIPNLPAVATQAAGLPQVFAFDSLKSLPHRDYLQPHYESQQQPAGKFHLGTCSGDNTACLSLCVPSCIRHSSAPLSSFYCSKYVLLAVLRQTD